MLNLRHICLNHLVLTAVVGSVFRMKNTRSVAYRCYTNYACCNRAVPSENSPREFVFHS